MKKKMKKIVPRGAVQPCVAECAKAGEAAIALNVRECDDALRVVGSPQSIGSIPAGHRLLLVDGDRYITLNRQNVMYDGSILATLQGDVVGAHRVGALVVVTTTAGIIYLNRTENGYHAVDLDEAHPVITLSALETSTQSAGMDAITFAQAYSSWPATLSTSDVSSLTTQLRRAWGEIQDNVNNAGAYAGMMQVRVGVRLIDDTYMWLSEPVTLGSDTLADSAKVTAECTLNGTAVTGIPATTLTRHRYRVGITVGDGISADWQPLVKAVDILATTCLPPVDANGTAQYRCIGIGGNVSRPRLQFGLPPVSEGELTSRLEQSGWHVIATTTDLAALSQNQWVSDAVATSSQTVTPGITSYVVTRAVVQSDRLTAQEAQDIANAGEPFCPVSSMTCNGRLYCIDGAGVLAVSEVGNPLVTARQQAITGAVVRSIMPLPKAIYSNGFGRYPVALFTDEGIYALPQTLNSGAFGEPRLLDRMVIAPQCHPIEGDLDLYFCSARGNLCRLSGSEVTVVWQDTGVCQLAWDEVHHEVWALTENGTMLAVMPSSHVSERSVECQQLYCDATHGLAVTDAGLVLDLCVEHSVNAQAFEWQSQPFSHTAPHEVVWEVFGDGTLTLEVTGERGISCHGFIVGRLSVTGQVNAPLRQRLVPQPLRTVRLSVRGTCNSGTLVLPVVI